MFRNLSIATKLFLTFVPIFLIGIAISIFFNNRFQDDQMQLQALESASQKAHIVRESLVQMMVESQVVDDKYLERVKKTADLNDLYIRIDTSRLHLAADYIDSSRIARLGIRMQDALAKDELDNLHGTQVLESGNQQWLLVNDNFRAMIPFKAEKKCQRCHDVQINDVLGVAHIEFPLTKIILANKENSKRSAIIFGSVAFIILVVSFIFFRMLVYSPIKKLERAAEEMSKGNMNEEIKPPKANNEIGKLTNAFIQLRSTLKETQDAMRISTVGQVAASLVQNFRGPIRQIENAIAEIKNFQIDTAKKNELLNEAREGAQLINKMTQDLIDFTSGDIGIEKKQTSVGKLLRSVTMAVKAELDKQNIHFNVSTLYDGLAPIDPDRTARALSNIITYAANYVPAGGKINIESTINENSLFIIVKDNGSSIPREFQEKIFEPFVKVVQSGGVGLDLALAKKIIEKQGGEITLQSDEGKGTIYTISLPMV